MRDAGLIYRSAASNINTPPNGEVFIFKNSADNKYYGKLPNGSIELLSVGGSIGGAGTLNFISKWTPDGSNIGNSQIFDDGSGIAIGTVTPNAFSFTINRTNNSKQEFILQDSLEGTSSNPIFVFKDTAGVDRAGMSWYSPNYTDFPDRANKLLVFNHWSDVIIYADESQGSKLYLTTSLSDFTKGVFISNLGSATNSGKIGINTLPGAYNLNINRSDEDGEAIVLLVNTNSGSSAASTIRFQNDITVSVIGYGSSNYDPVIGLNFKDRTFIRNISGGIIFSAENGSDIELSANITNIISKISVSGAPAVVAGSFITADAKTVTVTQGIITSIV